MINDDKTKDAILEIVGAWPTDDNQGFDALNKVMFESKNHINVNDWWLIKIDRGYVKLSVGAATQIQKEPELEKVCVREVNNTSVGISFVGKSEIKYYKNEDIEFIEKLE